MRSSFIRESRRERNFKNCSSSGWRRNRDARSPSVDLDYEICGGVEVEALTRRNDCRGAVFGDDGGAGVFLSWLQGVAGVELRGEVFAIELHLDSWLGKPAE